MMSAIESAEPMWPTPARFDCSRMIRRMRVGVSARASMGSLMRSPPSQDDGDRRRRAGAARHQAELGVRNLAGRFAPHLPDPLDHEVEAVDIHLGEVPPEVLKGSAPSGQPSFPSSTKGPPSPRAQKPKSSSVMRTMPVK